MFRWICIVFSSKLLLISKFLGSAAPLSNSVISVSIYSGATTPGGGGGALIVEIFLTTTELFIESGYVYIETKSKKREITQFKNFE